MPHNSDTVTVTKTKTATIVTEGATDTLTISAAGKPGPASNLAIGTVGTGDTAAATITGTAPTQTLNLTMPIGGRYKHTQGSASATWTITHNLGYEPGGVTVTDSAGTTVIGTIQHTSTNQIVVSFSSAFAGKAYIS
jgi:hypothetical protein